MEKRIMHIISGMLLVVALLFMTGCGKNGHAESQRTDTGTDAGMQTYSVYYMNQKWTEFSVYDTKIDQLESTENVIDKLMNLLISTEDEQLYKIPVADGMTYQRYSYDGKGLVTIMFNLDYDTAENYQILLCKMAFTKTLCQVNGISGVSFELSDLIGEKKVDTSVYNAESFSTIGDNFMEASYSVTIYTLDNTGKRLDKHTTEIDALSYKAPEEQIMEALRNSQEWKSPIDKDVDILDIYVLDRVCYVNFSKTFLDHVGDYDDKVIIYSLVDSLTELSDVDGVVFEVEGSQDLVYGENLDFSETYTANYSMCN